MRSENEVIQAVCEQVIHGIEKLGWDYTSDMDAFSDCIDMAMDMVVTDEEAETYPNIEYMVKTSIAL